MPAYMRFREVTCQERFCNALGRYDVFNTYNASQGCFCLKHAQKKVKELNDADAAFSEAIRQASPWISAEEKRSPRRY